MLLELLIAGSLTTYRPKQNILPNIKPNLELTQQLTPVELIQAPPHEKLSQLTQIPVAASKPAQTASTAATRTSKPPAGWFPWGQCTWYVWSKRSVGFWNNATDWLWQARRDGWSTGSTPRVGAIAWQTGHVALVTGISGSNVTVTESNHKGLGVITSRTVPATTFQYIY